MINELEEEDEERKQHEEEEVQKLEEQIESELNVHGRDPS